MAELRKDQAVQQTRCAAELVIMRKQTSGWPKLRRSFTVRRTFCVTVPLGRLVMTRRSLGATCRGACKPVNGSEAGRTTPTPWEMHYTVG